MNNEDTNNKQSSVSEDSPQSEIYKQYKEIFDLIKPNELYKDNYCSKNTVDVVKFVVDNHTKLENQKLSNKLEQQKMLANTVSQIVKYIVIGAIIFFLLEWIDNKKINFIKNINSDCNCTVALDSNHTLHN